ncbi:hypothetical protein IWW55_002073 [Coemansia sp. RSA 2706]|nr:hypothetical protein IWW55_002073 [Coemansia sp. RSA 2706]KAJ2310888.1 hypothetical protein IWW54_002942 [Coemansia sp. RSA 2705]KAJ2318918.1 hypothetical protein IWW52_002271 [Coemansia sp. RSA 2704]KAJ2327316.1 hypothetical protein IWW51_001821 [Coemansia sp. RSA 2702]KAJ2386711.1 hypothetical protein H4S02_003724 [Coemansia sp. RSA 2611]
MPKAKKLKLRTVLLKNQARRPVAKPAEPAKPSAKQSTKSRYKPFFPYTSTDTILLIGEGNFSFAHSIARTLGSAANIVATAHDSEPVAREKYSDIDVHTDAVRTLGGSVLFSVDGTQLDSCAELRGRKFTHIVFNFPHAGAGIKDQQRNIQTNQKLLLGFFRSARPLLIAGTKATQAPATDSIDYSSGSDGEVRRPSSKRRKRAKREQPVQAIEFDGVQAEVVYDVVEGRYELEQELQKPGQIHVTLKSGLPYDQWNILQLARECGLASRPTRVFDLDAFPGYEHRRTLGFKDGVSKDANQEIGSKKPKLYMFTRSSQTDGEPAGPQAKPKSKHRLGVNSETFDGVKRRRRPQKR